MDNNFSSEYKSILETSRNEAIRHKCAEIEPAHLLLAIAKDTSSRAFQLMSALTDISSLNELTQNLDNGLFKSSSNTVSATAIASVLQAAQLNRTAVANSMI